jgi:hypothetical protein
MLRRVFNAANTRINTGRQKIRLRESEQTSVKFTDASRKQLSTSRYFNYETFKDLILMDTEVNNLGNYIYFSKTYFSQTLFENFILQ